MVAFGQALWTLGYIFELTSATLAWKFFWDDFQWLGAIGWYFGFLVFSVNYVGLKIKNPRRFWTIISIVPIVFLLLLATNNLTHLIHGEGSLIPGEPFSALEYDFTITVWTFAIISYLLFLSGLYLLIRDFFSSEYIQKRQKMIILFGTLIPLVGTFLSLSGLHLGQQRDFTPLTFAISNLIVLFGLTRFRLFNLLPVAREVVFENMVDAVIVLDNYNCIADQNPAARILTKVPLNKILGLHVSKVFGAWPDLLALFDTGDHPQGEVVVDISEGNNRKQYKLYVSPLLGQLGLERGVVILGRNVTELDLMEDALREREENYRTLVETTQDWVWKFDLAGVHTFSNQAVQKLLGYSVNEVVGRSAFAMTDPLQQEQILGLITNGIMNNAGWRDMIIRWRHKNGTYRTFESNAQPVFDSRGKVIGFSGIDRDVTERIEMEEALKRSKRDLEDTVQERTRDLRHSEEKYRSVVETADEGIFVLKQDQLVFVNPKTTEISGYSEQELLQIPWINLVHPQERDLIRRQIQRYMTGDAVQTDVDKFRMIDKQGNVKWLESKTQKIFWEGDLAILSAISDVTAKVEAERDLRNFAEQLDILHQIDQAILAAQSVEEIAQTALEHMQNVVPFIAGSIILFDFEANQVHRLGHVVPDGYELDPEAPLGDQEKQREILRLLERGLDLDLPHASESKQWKGIGKSVVLGMTMETILGVPIILEGDLLGAMMVAAPESEAFKSKHIDLVHQVCAVLAVALRQARLFDAEQEARKTAETMRAANLALTKSLELDMVLETLLNLISELVPYDSANVMLYEDQKYLVVRASRGYEHWVSSANPESIAYEVDKFPLFRDVKDRLESIVVPNAAEYAEWVWTDEGAHIGSWIGVPLVAGGELIGLLSIDHKEPNFYTEEHRVLAELLASQATIAIQNAGLFEQTIQRARELEEITRISTALRFTNQQTEIFSVLLDETMAFFEADAGVVFLVDEGEIEASVLRGPENTVLKVFNHEPTMEFIWEVGQMTEPLFLPEQPIDSRYDEKVSSLALLPLTTNEGNIGVLLLAWVEHREFTTADRRLLKALTDITGNALDRARIFETLEQQVANRTRDLSVLYQVTSVASAHIDLMSITDKSLDRILAAVGGHAGSIHIRKPEERHFQLVSHRGIPDELLEVMRSMPVDDQFFGSITRKDEPLVIMGFKEDARVPAGLLPLDCEVYIGTPIRTRGQIRGILSIYLESSQQYNTDNVRLLMMAVDQMGIALERALLQEQAEQAIIIEERQRLARELHDAVTQSLYSLTLMADAARKFNDQAMWARSEHYLRMVQSTAIDVLKEMRLLVFELRPSALENEGFVNALRQRLDTVEARAGVETNFDIDQAVVPPIDIQVALYRIAQEALNNALKHSQATSVKVGYFADKDRIELMIQDNGHGFEPEQASSGIGLKSMRERVEKFGGDFCIESNADQGTTVTAVFKEIHRWQNP